MQLALCRIALPYVYCEQGFKERSYEARCDVWWCSMHILNWMRIGCASIVFTWHNRQADLKQIVVSMGVIHNSKGYNKQKVVNISVIHTRKDYKVLEMYISLPGRLFWGLSHLQYVALRAAGICQNKVAQQKNHWDYFNLPCCTTLLSHQKTSLFLHQVMSQ